VKLKPTLKARRLPVTGKKAVLIERLQEWEAIEIYI